MNRWKAALNAFAITFEGRVLPTDNQTCQRQLHRIPGVFGRVYKAEGYVNGKERVVAIKQLKEEADEDDKVIIIPKSKPINITHE